MEDTYHDMDLLASPHKSMVDSEYELCSDMGSARDPLYDKRFIDKKLNSLLYNLGGPTYLLDEDMIELATVSLEDGFKYTMSKSSESTYTKIAAADRTYHVKVDEQYHGHQEI